MNCSEMSNAELLASAVSRTRDRDNGPVLTEVMRRMGDGDGTAAEVLITAHIAGGLAARIGVNQEAIGVYAARYAREAIAELAKPRDGGEG